MKKIFTLSLLALIAIVNNASSQSTRLVLAEEFTQASCPPCASQNPAYNTLLNNNATKVVAIKYQTDWPGTDPMNVQTAALVDQRVTYYHADSVGVPYAVMDGIPQSGGSYKGAPANWSQSKINARAAVTSPFTITVAHHLNSAADSIFISVDIACTQNVTGTLVAHVAIIEREVEFCAPPGTNGELDFEGVMRDMLPNALGTALAGTWTSGQTQTINFGVKVRSYIYDKSQLAVVAFIQDLAPCHWPNCSTIPSILQAGFSAPQPLSADCKFECNTNSSFVCGTDYASSLEIKNTGSAALTAVDINYTLDGAAMPVINWTGNLAPQASTSVAVPPITSVLGQRTLSFTISNPNGQPDLNPALNTKSFSFYDYGLTGIPLPVVQAFAASTFPPTNWRNYNPDFDAGWSRSTTGLNGTGSARMYFYSSGPNLIDELWLPNSDFSRPGTTTAQLDFDLANCQYSFSGTLSNDQLQIQYSTDCGQNWTTVFDEAGAVLANGNPSSQTNWVATASSWHHKTVNLNGAVGSSGVFIKFKATSDNGNNCFLDNINIETNLTTAVPVINKSNDLVVYPNPTTGLVNISGLSNNADATITITNALGSVVRTIDVTNHVSDIYTVDLSNEAKGFYEISVRTNDNVITKRVSVTE